MKKLDLKLVAKYVNANIGSFHDARLNSLRSLKLIGLLKRKNPYLFKAKHVVTAAELVAGLLDAYLSSSEEKLFGDFLEELAIFISRQTAGGKKSSTKGIDLEFTNDEVHYLVSVKSGPNWGNAGQYADLKRNFVTAKKVLSQSRSVAAVQPVLGICYGKTRPINNGEYLKLTGQSFWYFLSENPNLYIDIIEPIGFQAKQHNAKYEKEKTRVYNEFTGKFINDFCPGGQIEWQKLVELNSKNIKPGERPW
jgi:hypothetical protein